MSHNEKGGLATTGAASRIRSLLSQTDNDSVNVPERVFSELLKFDEKTDKREWLQQGRWIRFEEWVEHSGSRWSKPHLSTVELQAVLTYRSFFEQGNVRLNSDARTFPALIHELASQLNVNSALSDTVQSDFEALLQSPKVHQFTLQKKLKNKHKTRKTANGLDDKLVHSPSSDSEPEETAPQHKIKNKKLFKKLPHDAEAFMIFVGSVDWLEHPVATFVRLEHAESLKDINEVGIPTRFVLCVFGPRNHEPSYMEIGRTAASLMADDTFRHVAYKATTAEHFVDGVDEFMRRAIVVQPAEWDPRTRLDPPAKKPGLGAAGPAPQKQKALHGDTTHHEEHGGHGIDPALLYTKKFFGGFIADVKRKAKWYLSDFRDCIHLQCLASMLYMYFALVPNAVAFGGMMQVATNNYIGTVETLLGNAIAGLLFTLFSGQPMNVLGPTGPMMIFETIVFMICGPMNFEYLPFRFWIGVWSAFYMLILVATDASMLVSLITRFTEESFAFLVAVVFVYKSFESLTDIGRKYYFVASKDINLIGSNATYCHCLPQAKVDYTSVKAWNGSLARAPDYKTRYPHLALSAPFLTVADNTTVSDVNWAQVPASYCQRFNGVLAGSCTELRDIVLMSLILMLFTFALVKFLKIFRHANFFPTFVRQIGADFAIIIAIAIMTGIDIAVGIDTPKLTVPHKFAPTDSVKRGWLVSPFGSNAWYSCLVAAGPALLATILMFMDQHITAVIVNRKDNKLKKGAGYHLDLFVIAVTVVICSIFGLTWMVAATVIALTNIDSLKMESECRAPGEKPTFVGCREQRVSLSIAFILLGVSIFMGPLLKYIPMPVLYGVFLYMGITALGGLQLMDRLALFLMPVKHQPDHTYLRHVSLKRVHLFTIIQVACLAALFAIKQYKHTAILFPLMLVAMVGVRKLMSYMFTYTELEYLDDILPELSQLRAVDSKRALTENDKEANNIDLVPSSLQDDGLKVRRSSLTPQNEKMIVIPKGLDTSATESLEGQDAGEPLLTSYHTDKHL